MDCGNDQSAEDEVHIGRDSAFQIKASQVVKKQK